MKETLRIRRRNKYVMMTAAAAERVLEQVFGLMNEQGSGAYHGEPVTQLEHMLQAGDLALRDEPDAEMVLAAFLHDIGHLCGHLLPVAEMDGLGVEDHEAVGEAYLLAMGFSGRVGRLVRSHVEAKRYLACREPGYLERLSDASRRTLLLQGGPMTAVEADLFAADPDFHSFLRLRAWDDAAKVPGIEPTPISYFRELAYQHLTRENR